MNIVVRTPALHKVVMPSEGMVMNISWREQTVTVERCLPCNRIVKAFPDEIVESSHGEGTERLDCRRRINKIWQDSWEFVSPRMRVFLAGFSPFWCTEATGTESVVDRGVSLPGCPGSGNRSWEWISIPAVDLFKGVHWANGNGRTGSSPVWQTCGLLQVLPQSAMRGPGELPDLPYRDRGKENGRSGQGSLS